MCAGLEYWRASERFREAILGLWRAFWEQAPGTTPEEFEGAKKQTEAEAKGLKRRESLRRHAELGLAVMPDLGQFAMPREMHRKVLDLAESGNQSERGVAHYIADASRDTLREPFKGWQNAKLGMGIETQRVLASIGTDALCKYTLARTRFEQAEKQFLDDVQEVLRLRREKTAAETDRCLAWRITKDPPPVLRMVA